MSVKRKTVRRQLGKHHRNEDSHVKYWRHHKYLLGMDILSTHPMTKDVIQTLKNKFTPPKRTIARNNTKCESSCNVLNLRRHHESNHNRHHSNHRKMHQTRDRNINKHRRIFNKSSPRRCSCITTLLNQYRRVQALHRNKKTVANP